MSLAHSIGGMDLRTLCDIPEPLTRRELEILNLKKLGITNKEVGRLMQIKENTVKNHNKVIVAKLGGRDMTGSVYRAVIRGIIA